MPTRREWERREKQRRGDDPALPEGVSEGQASDDAAASEAGGGDFPAGTDSAPPLEPGPDTNPAHSLDPKEAYTGRSDQDVTRNTGTGAGGATEWGGGNKNHPSRIAGKPPGG